MKGWKNKLQLGIFVALCVIAGGLIILFLVIDTEESFLEGAPQWEQDDFPLVVCGATYTVEVAELQDDTPEAHWRTLTDDDEGALKEAISRANTRLADLPFGQNKWTFHYGLRNAGDTCRIWATIGVPAEPGWMDPGGDATLRDENGRLIRCNIQTSNTTALLSPVKAL